MGATVTQCRRTESVTVACAEAQRKPWTWGRQCVGVVSISVDAWSKRTQGFRFLHKVEENNVVKWYGKCSRLCGRGRVVLVDISRSRVRAELTRPFLRPHCAI